MTPKQLVWTAVAALVGAMVYFWYQDRHTALSNINTKTGQNNIITGQNAGLDQSNY